MSSAVYEPVSREPEDEKLLGETDRVLSARISRSRRAWNWAWWISYIALLAAVVYLGLALGMERRRRGSTEIAGDVNGIVPSFSRQIVTLKPEPRYVGDVTSPTFKNDTKHHWLALVPKGLGFVEIKNPEQYPALAAPYMKYNKTVYTTSVTHQLHCLYMIMHGFNDLALKGSLKMDMEADEGLTREGEDPADHLSHCFDYLRQTILCHGDTALEGLQTTFGPEVGGSDGWNTQHVCRRYEEVYQWLEGKRIDERVWI
ncbi:hypothetical protein LTR62_000401 [Meristemomyces frigidus]|uniref:Oxidase ustYa n=1 Tax=Meristemomyces frigidus TaxID=1508187 RepID=A0AAN7TPC6_9PEZI|nr:hypothetical protein LTR62_000401 [Meristemomyces frigidus]